MTQEDAIVKAVAVRLKNRCYQAAGELDFEAIRTGVMQEIDLLQIQGQRETLASKSKDIERTCTKELAVTNEITTKAICKARQALYDILNEVIIDPEFDPDRFISNIVYWYELQGLAKSYNKKLFYIAKTNKGGK